MQFDNFLMHYFNFFCLFILILEIFFYPNQYLKKMIFLWPKWKRFKSWVVKIKMKT